MYCVIHSTTITYDLVLHWHDKLVLHDRLQLPVVTTPDLIVDDYCALSFVMLEPLVREYCSVTALLPVPVGFKLPLAVILPVLSAG